MSVMHVELPDGTPHQLKPGDWIIIAGKQIVDTVAYGERLEDRYEAVPDGILIPRNICAAIEGITGIGTLRSAKDLLAAVNRLARIEIGTVKIDFTPGQLEEIKHRASKRGYTVEQELRRIIDRIKDEIFYRS